MFVYVYVAEFLRVRLGHEESTVQGRHDHTGQYTLKIQIFFSFYFI